MPSECKSSTPKEAIMGISALYHDSGVALVEKTGKILFATHEERYTRTKHDRRIPHSAMKAAKQFCHDNNIIIIKFCYYEDPELKLERQYFNVGYMYAANTAKKRNFLKEASQNNSKQNLTSAVKAVFGPDSTLEFNSNHHLSHAASSFLTSGFDEYALTFVFDGVGEWDTSSAYISTHNDLQKIWHRDFPNSLGLFYSTMTQLCGFKVNTGEYKLMGLAPYGEPIYVDLLLTNVIPRLPHPAFFELNMKYFDFLLGEKMASNALLNLFGLDKTPTEGGQKKVHLDIAASAQRVLEIHIARIINFFVSKHKTGNICLAGGVALNCVNNSKIAALNGVSTVHVQPAAGDAGSALGAALLEAKKNKSFKNTPMPVPYLGNSYSQEKVLTTLKAKGLKGYTVFGSENEYINEVANLLEKKNIGGWFHHRSEFGPRALGARSILARADSIDMQQKVNLQVKFRENFRPFAPIVLEEEARQYFELDSPSPFMLRTYKVKNSIPAGPLAGDNINQDQILQHLKKTNGKLAAITHVDGSARVQTVSIQNGLIHKLLKHYYKLTGHGVLINTSFNVRGEPIVETPSHAIDCFLGTNMDFLAIEGVLISKESVATKLLKINYNQNYGLD